MIPKDQKSILRNKIGIRIDASFWKNTINKIKNAKQI